MGRRIMLLVIFTTVASTYITGQTWNGAVNSDWNTAANWTPATVPGTGSNVTINNAATPFQPVLAGDVTITSLTMSQGILNLNNFALTCSGSASLTGDSLLNGKIVANSFTNIQNMRMGGKIIFDKTGAGNNFWGGNNKVYTDSLVIVWRSGTLHLESAAPDSIFSYLKIQVANSSTVSFSTNFLLYVRDNLIIDNTGNGTFSWASAINTVIGGNLVTLNFSNTTTNLILRNITTLGNNANGPFYGYTGNITNCIFAGNFTLVADSSQTFPFSNSSFLGADNLFQSGSFDFHDNRFGQTGPGTTIIKAAHNVAGNVYLRDGKNKYFGNVQYETYAVMPGGLTIQQTFYGPDTCLGNMGFILKGNSALTTNGGGNNYVAGNVIIDGQGARKWVQFSGGAGNTFTVGGNFTAMNFTPYSEPGVGNTNVYLHNVIVAGTDTCGTFYCYTGDITNSNFNGNFKLYADSSNVYGIDNTSLLGASNFIQAGNFDIKNSRFGQVATGTTFLKATHNIAASVLVREGNNKFLNNVEYELNALYPGGTTLQQTFYGQDTCLGNMSYIMKGNAALTTNDNGNSYVAGNVIIDGQGARKWVQFTGGAGNTFTVGGNFTAKNFTPFPEPGVGNTNVYFHNVIVAGTDTCGTFYCYTGDITNSRFNGNFKLYADSSNIYGIDNTSLLGASNFIQAGNFDIKNSRFGQVATGTTFLKATHNIAGSVLVREGNNKFFNNVEYELNALYPGGTTLQQTFYGQDTCLGNMSYIMKGNSALTTNDNGNSYVAGNVMIDGQGARKWVQFTGGAGRSFTVDGNFTAKNFSSNPVPGVGITNVYLRNVYAGGADTCGTFYCISGDIQNSRFIGNFKLMADSSQTYSLNGVAFLGADNIFQSGSLDVQSSRFGQTGTGTTILRAAHNVAGTVYMRDGNNKFLGNLQWDGYTTTGSLLIQQTFYGQDSCFGSLAMSLSGLSSVNLGGNNLYLAKGLSLNNNGTGSIIHNSGGSAIHFIGSDTADYSYGGSGSAPAIRNIELNKQGAVRLQSPLTFSGGLTFTRGMVLSTLTNPLNIPAGANIAGAWDSSYADGPVIKTGNTAFIFPLGKKNIYAPLSITAPASATDAFEAQFIFSNAHDAGYDSTQYDPTLHHISRKEFWLLDRINGTATPKVTLSWKTSRSGIVNVIGDLRVARWNGSIWKDEGIGSTTGTNDEGTIQSLNNISAFSPFTLASGSSNNPLPVHFLLFNTILRADRSVSVQWKTGPEINNAWFEVQRSNDGRNWMPIAVVLPQLSLEYEYIDHSMTAGVNYYRVKQLDRDGLFIYSPVKAIRITGLSRLFIWPNPVKDYLYVQTPFAQGTLEITDINGRRMKVAIINNTITIIPVRQMAKGLYVIRVQRDGEVYTEKFMIE